MMSSIRNPRKLYVSNVARDAREKDVGRLFEECGRIVRLQFKANFAFVEYDSNASAEDAVNKFNGKDFMGRRLVVEPYVYRGGDPRFRPQIANDRRDMRSWRPMGSGTGYRLLVYGLDSMTSWQDLKDFGRSGGKSATFADVFIRRGKKEGIIEYRDGEDFKQALKYLEDARLNGVKVHVAEDVEWNKKLTPNHGNHKRYSGEQRNGNYARSRSRSRSWKRDRDRDRSKEHFRRLRTRNRSMSYERPMANDRNMNKIRVLERGRDRDGYQFSDDDRYQNRRNRRKRSEEHR